MLRVIEKAGDDSQTGELLIEALPGLNCYEGGQMAESVIKKSFGDDSDPDLVLNEESETESIAGEEN
jgi:hypothetical protein